MFIELNFWLIYMDDLEMITIIYVMSQCWTWRKEVSKLNIWDIQESSYVIHFSPCKSTSAQHNH